jgi:transcriptional regulator with XRE-family HTH domain
MEIQLAFGQRLKRRRMELRKTQSQIATASGISTSYYCEIENGKSVPPPPIRLREILSAAEFCETEAYELVQLASIARGLLYGEADLPEEVQTLIRVIRSHAHELNPRFIKGLQSKIREVVG